jgi:hypothetical protein
MLRLQAGELEAAWDDLLACHRLARLAGQGPTAVEAIQANDERGCVGDQALLQHTNLSAAQIAKMRADLDGLLPMPRIADKVDVGERFAYLGSVFTAALEPRPSAASRAASRVSLKNVGKNDMELAALDLILDAARDAEVDWNVALRMGNRWFDRLVDAVRKPTHTERMRAVEEADRELQRLLKAVNEKKLPDQWLPDDPRKLRSGLIGAACLALYAPSMESPVVCRDRDSMRFEVTKLAFAVAAYRADRGSYPATLAELLPQYLAEVPKDVFNNDSDLHYTRQGDGYLLYSVGQNGRDDGGKGFDDRKKGESWEEMQRRGEDWDDLAVRVPAKP